MKTKSSNPLAGFPALNVKKIRFIFLNSPLAAFLIAACLIQFCFVNQASGSSAKKPAAVPAPSDFLANPVKLGSFAGCAANNLRHERFSRDYDLSDRVRLCELLDALRAKLWSVRGRAAELDFQVAEMWRVAPYLYFGKIGFGERVWKGVSGSAAFTNIFYPETGRRDPRGTISLSLNAKRFAHTFLHELRHVRDLYDKANGSAGFSERELEERGFLIESYYTEATGERISFWKEFWRDEWKQISRFDRRELALRSINKYLRRHYEFDRTENSLIARTDSSIRK